MADTLDVLTLAEAKVALKIDETSNDTRLAQAITGVSRALDRICGPVVARTISAEPHHHLARSTTLRVRYRPVLSFTTVAEYDTAGAATTLTAEDHDTKPADAYLAQRREGLGAPYSGELERRSSGLTCYFDDQALVTYVAGRYADTDAVDDAFKESASVILLNWWQQVLAQAPAPGVELDLPGFRFPRYAVPDAALGILPQTEIRRRTGVA